MPNEFYVQPASTLPGMTKLFEGMATRADTMKAETAERDKMAKRQEAARILSSGDSDAMAQFAMKNPWIIDDIEKVTKFKSAATKQNLIDSAKRILGGENPSQVLIDRAERVIAEGGDPTETMGSIQQAQRNPDAAKKEAEMVLALYDPASHKQYKAMSEPEKDTRTDKIKNFEYHRNLMKDDPIGAAKFAEITGSEYAPSPLKKLIGEMEALKEEGADPALIKAYEDNIFGDPVDVNGITQEQIDTLAALFNLTGKMPSLGRGKESTRVRVAIAKSAAQQALGSKNFGDEDPEPNLTPMDAALSIVASQSDTKAIQGSLNLLDKQLSSMGSFVSNIEMQIDEVSALSKDLTTYDARILNMPLRLVRGRIKGSALQAKYDLYLTEIESEIGKLATGSTASVAELSASAQERWAKIHDKNLSVSDMLELLEETRAAAKMRKKSVETQLNLTRGRMRTRDYSQFSGSQESSVKEMSTEDLQKIVRGQ